MWPLQIVFFPKAAAQESLLLVGQRLGGQLLMELRLMGSAWRSVWVYIMKSCSALPCLRRFFLDLMENQALFRPDRGYGRQVLKCTPLFPSQMRECK